MRLRDLQQVLGKFTDNEKGTIISDCPIYIPHSKIRKDLDRGISGLKPIEDNDENYADMINRLIDSEFDYRTRIVTGALRRQIFITGPHGVIIELNYPPEAPPP